MYFFHWIFSFFLHFLVDQIVVQAFLVDKHCLIIATIPLVFHLMSYIGCF